jgi:predicted DsbA family dithiol-disulfide isomerase
LQIEIFSDVVCPWCYLGLARLELALQQRPQIGFDVHWLPFQLNPAMPPEGRDRREYMRERFGDVDRFADAQRQLRELGIAAGIDYRFERIERAPNTRRAHVLIAWARRHGLQRACKRAVMEGYFTRGLDAGDPEVLADIAAQCRLDRAEARAALDDAGLHAEVERLEALGRGWNVSGVPTFIFGRRYALSGAQPPEIIVEVLDRLANEQDSAGAAATPSS